MCGGGTLLCMRAMFALIRFLFAQEFRQTLRINVLNEIMHVCVCVRRALFTMLYMLSVEYFQCAECGGGADG